jgi:formylglycine-generating enzyme required for sulfatase activity
LAKRKKSKSKNKGHRPVPRAQVLPVEEPRSTPEPVTVQDKRVFYAIGAAVVVVLIGVTLWFIIHKSNEDAFLNSLAPGSKGLEQAAETGADRPAMIQARATPTARVLRDRLKSGGEGPEMVVVAAGSFQMGDIQGRDKSALPVHTIRIQKPFAIGRYEVTFEEYDKFAQATGRKLPNDGGGGRGRQPVINFSWQDAVHYATWLSEQAGKRYRLPTEAEWEYAARGGTETDFWWGSQMKSGIANCAGCGSQWDEKVTAPVGSFPPNPFGLYDTAGNVWEWVEDCDHEDYKGAPTDGSAWQKEGDGNCYLRVFRGGAWNYGVRGLRSWFRGRGDPDNHSAVIGFRVLREMD